MPLLHIRIRFKVSTTVFHTAPVHVDRPHASPGLIGFIDFHSWRAVFEDGSTRLLEAGTGQVTIGHRTTNLIAE